jgi:hypothetical protein
VPAYTAAPTRVLFSDHHTKEAHVESRFETFPDPCNNWIVWDLEKDNIAEAHNQKLQFLSEARARELCAFLNRQASKLAA